MIIEIETKEDLRIPGRSFSNKDLAANITGILSASIIPGWLFSRIYSFLAA